MLFRSIEAVQTMARIIERTEEEMLERIPPLRTAPKSKGGAITKAASEVGQIVNAKFLITLPRVAIQQGECRGFVQQFL